MLEKPRRWNVGMIRRFMIVFGITSSVFDYLTFGVLLFFLHATPDLFRTGWFVESVVSASLIVLVVRTRNPFFHSRPASPLMVTTILIVTLTVLLPFIPFVRNLFGFKPLPLFFYAALGLVVMLYVIAAEIVKRYFYRHVRL